MRTKLSSSVEDVEVYQTSSGLGGHFTVSIEKEIGNGVVDVRIWYGHSDCGSWISYGLFDGKVFRTSKDKLMQSRLRSR